jgi:WD40-like Beta Propeller Repeat
VVSFLVNPAANPVPAVTSVSPKAATVGSTSFTLTVNGSNFISNADPTQASQVRFNLGPTQTSLPIVNISASQITATVDASLLINATTAPITAIVTVYNPPAAGTPPANGGVANPNSGGGGTSPGGLSFTVNPVGTPSNAAPRAEAAAEDTPAVSADGRYVAYAATQGDHSQVFVRDTCEGADSGCQSHTSLLSAASDATVGNNDSRSPSMSSDGRYIAFSSAATNLAAASSASSSTTATGRQIYLRDTCAGADAKTQCSPSTQLISTDPAGALVGTEGILPSVSASGRFVAFLAVTPSHAASAAASASNAAPKSAASASTTNSGFRQVFVRDTCTGATSCTPKTTRISLQPGDTSSSDAKPAGPALSGSSARVAVPGAATATVFTHSVAVDDRIFLALTGSHP